MTEKNRTFNLLDLTQEFLTVEEPNFPQSHFDGKHKVDIWLPNCNITKKQRDQVLSYVFKVTTSALLVAVETDLSMGKLRTENKNQANARATRAPNAEKTMRDAWLTALANKNFELAERMLATDVSNAEMYNLKDVQLDKKRKELASAKESA